MSTTRRRLLDDTLKKSVVGNPAVAQGSLARRGPGITMQGWTEQEETTGAQLFDISTAISGKYISDTDGREVDGEGTYASDYIAVSGLSNIICNDTQRRRWMAFYDAEKTYVSGKNGYGVPIPVPENAAYARFTIANDNIGSFMLNEGSILKPYEPYTGGHPSPSPDYPQEIISSGLWNETAQKWEYEIEISNAEQNPTEIQTVTLQSDRPLTKWDKLEKRNGQWGWVYGSAEVDMSSEVTWNIRQGYEQETSNLFRGVMSGVDEIDSTDLLLCNILPYYQAALLDVNGIYSLGNNLFARIIGIKSLEDFQEKIQGGKVLTKLSTETFVPITTAEQEAMEALHTYRPTTVLSNDAGCEMSLTYKTRKSMEVTA